jgi:hypothetical protein
VFICYLVSVVEKSDGKGCVFKEKEEVMYS